MPTSGYVPFQLVTGPEIMFFSNDAHFCMATCHFTTWLNQQICFFLTLPTFGHVPLIHVTLSENQLFLTIPTSGHVALHHVTLPDNILFFNIPTSGHVPLHQVTGPENLPFLTMPASGHVPHHPVTLPENLLFSNAAHLWPVPLIHVTVPESVFLTMPTSGHVPLHQVTGPENLLFSNAAHLWPRANYPRDSARKSDVLASRNMIIWCVEYNSCTSFAIPTLCLTPPTHDIDLIRNYWLWPRRR